jgi:TP901 family phage tail tape measure protein
MGKNVIALDILMQVKGATELSQLSTNMKSLKEIVGELNTDIKRMSDSFTKSIATVSQTIITIQGLGNILGQFSQQYADFETSMRMANTMAHKDAEGFKEMTDQINELAKRVPIAREQLAAGLYQTISNGVEEPQWLDFLEQSAKAAAGSGAELEGVVTVTSTILKNYGKAWEDARGIQDMIQKTAELGVTSFGELQQALPRVTANAATLGVSIEELMGTFATLTGVSGNTAEVSTQLAAIFTALIKPSSEASKMAAEMGIQFDAAAIKAAGGFQQFLTNFHQQVEQYAASTGMLEEEIMGKFFGSAESFRALIPLTGNLASTFEEKCAAMSEAAGATEFAFGEVLKTTASDTQLAKNAMSGFFDTVGKIAAVIQPYMQWVAVLGLAISGVKMLYTTLIGLKGAVVAMTAAIRSGIARWFAYCDRLMATTTLARQATIATRGLSLALKALPIVEITMGLIELGEALFGSSEAEDVAAQKAKELAEEQARLMKEYQDWKYSLTDISQSVADIAAKEMSALQRLYDVAKDDAKSRKERAAAISELKRQWPDYFNQISAERIEVDKLAQAYTNAKNAILDMASVKAIENKLAANAGERLELEQNLKTYNSGVDYWQNAVDKLQRYINDSAANRDVISDKKLRYFYEGLTVTEEGAGEKSLADYLTGGLIPLSIDGGNKDTLYYSVYDILGRLQQNLSIRKGEKSQAEKKILDLQNADEYLVGEREKISARLKGSFGSVKPGPTAPASQKPVYRENATVLKDINENVRYWQEQLSGATIETAPQINANIEYWQKLANAVRNAGKETEKTMQEWHDVPTTINEIRENIAILRSQLEATDVNDVDTITKINNQINAYNKQIDALNDLGTAAEKTEEKFTWHEAPKTLKEIGDNIAKLQNDLLNATSVDDAAGINRQIAKLEKLEDAYRKAGKQGQSAFEALRSGWNGVKGIGGGVESLTQALEGNGDTWKTLTGIVDGFLQIYDGLQAIIGMIDAISGVTEILTANKTEEAAATTGAVVAEGVQAAAAPEMAAAQTPVIAANKAAAASYMELAAAAFYAAHAFIPFAGFGIATGFIAAAKTIVTSMGATPFANGGIVSGPTVGLIGEYAGASNNPEVVAPLDKLRSMITPAGQPVIVGGTLRASGRDIVCVLANETRITSKSGKRTNIRL